MLVLAMTLASPVRAGEIRFFERGSWKAILSEHAGQPLVVHFWGVTCGPCRVELPEWGRLLSERKDLNFVTVNADLVQDAPEAVTRFLADAGVLAAESWSFSNQFAERLRYEINPEWQGEIPATYLIARDGSGAWIDGSADMNDIRAWLDRQRER
jgi:thiol-disulfide isomerase/thioredoxin